MVITCTPDKMFKTIKAYTGLTSNLILNISANIIWSNKILQQIMNDTIECKGTFTH